VNYFYSPAKQTANMQLSLVFAVVLSFVVTTGATFCQCLPPPGSRSLRGQGPVDQGPVQRGLTGLTPLCPNDVNYAGSPLCTFDTAINNAPNCVNCAGTPDPAPEPETPCEKANGVCVKNCGNGKQTNCSDVCRQTGVSYDQKSDAKQCSAATAGGRLCEGNLVCCRCLKKNFNGGK